MPYSVFQGFYQPGYESWSKMWICWTDSKLDHFGRCDASYWASTTRMDLFCVFPGVSGRYRPFWTTRVTFPPTMWMIRIFRIFRIRAPHVGSEYCRGACPWRMQPIPGFFCVFSVILDRPVSLGKGRDGYRAARKTATYKGVLRRENNFSTHTLGSYNSHGTPFEFWVFFSKRRRLSASDSPN